MEAAFAVREGDISGVAWAVGPFRASARPFNRAVAGRLALRSLGHGYLPRVGLVVALYYAAAHVGYALQFAGPIAAVVWLPVGVGIAALYLLGLRLWPAIVVGDLLVNNYSALPVGAAIGQSFGNLLEVMIAVWLLHRLAERDAPLSTMSSLTGVFLAIAAGTLVSASIGSLSLRLGGAVSAHSLPPVWGTWWLGDFCGAMLVLPLTLAWLPLRRRRWPKRETVEGVLVLATVAALSMLAFGSSGNVSYLALPALSWAGLRFGPGAPRWRS